MRLAPHTSQVGDERSPRAVAAARHDHDPIPRFEHSLLEHDILDGRRRRELASRADAEVADAVEFARRAPDPPPERAFADIY
jgi:TPP-dependent pyruvate/acetoin dehydrogenase alpha subunit